MKFYKLLAAVMFFCFIGAKAELVNLNPDPTGTPWVTGGYKYGAAEEAKYNSLPYVEITPEARTKVLDPMVDNTTGASGVYFRPVFHQGDYGNCAQAAAIGYAFTYEINRLRQLPANLEGNTKNQYPVNYTYNYWNNGESGTGSTFDNAETTGREYGIPNSEIWYEVTGDYLTGNAVQWMNGYEKYFDLFENRGAMQNRIKERIQFGDMTDPANIDKLKIYLDNHGYGSETGGVAVFGFDMEHADWDQIPPNYYMGNKSIFINTGIDFDHGMTIVGYDDNVAFDFEVEYPQPRQPFDPPLPPSNKYQNGSDKPMALWEVGALKIANSWGNGWPTSYDGGFIYLPYRLLAQGKVNGVCAIVPESDHEVQLAYKVNLFHELRNKMDYSAAMSINPASDPADSDVLEYQIITSQNKMGGLLPVQGVNSDPIEYGLDVTDFFKDAFKGTTDMYYPKKFFFIVDDISSAQPVIPNEILSFELYDHRNNNELHIRCNENNKVIAPDDRTSMSIIYDIFNNNEDFNNNEEVIHISDNVGFSLPAGISGKRTLSVANNSRLYFHNTSFDSRIPFGLPATDRPCIVIEGSAEFIGFDESTEDFINAEDTDFIINSILYLENCDLIMGESSVLVLNDNAEIIVSERSELVISPSSNVQFGVGSKITLEKGGKLTILDGSNITYSIGSCIVVKSGSTLKLSDDITMPAGSLIALEPGANLVIDGNIRITGNIQMADGANIDILDNSSLGLQLSQVTILPATSLTLGSYSQLIIENGSNLIFEDGAVVELAEGAEIIVMDDGSIITNNNNAAMVTFTSSTGSTGNWEGITCEVGSTLELNGVKIKGATTAVSGIHFSCTISNSLFENCPDGINIVDCDNYSITLNTFTGMDTGTGVSLAVSNGTFWKNTVENFDYGVRVTSCPPILSNNVICNNKRFGIYIFGYNSNPQLILSSKAQGVNNSIINNGTNPPSSNPFGFSDAQIGIMPFGNVFLDGGMNNIHSGQADITPLIPCISVAPRTIDPPLILEPSALLIEATGNYWGAKEPTAAFFDLRWDEYSINYNPWYTEPLTGETVQPSLSSHVPPSTESTILSNAIFLEEKENYTASIKQYEHVIDKYEDTPEYYVALARLPYVYLKAGIETESLISTYDAGLITDDIAKKKFLKEMKISTHIKGKRYETAKALAEEMKAEALTDDEITLAEIDIDICNIMIATESKGGKSTTDYMAKLNNLLSQSYGEGKSELASITENIIPSTTMLYQNYPNPFNPVTQIRFAIAKTTDVKLSVYNISGQKVAVLASGVMNAGKHAVDFDGSKFNSGIYYYTLEIDGKNITKKMVLTK